MTRDPATLHGRDAHAFRIARQAVDIGRHQRTFTAADFARVVNRWIAGGIHDRAIARANQRADRAEAETRALLERVGQLEHELLRHTAVPIDAHQPSHKRVAVLTPRQAQVFDAARRGVPHTWIAQQFGISRTSVSNYVARAAEALEADNVPHALWLANSGVVEVRVKQRRRAA